MRLLVLNLLGGGEGGGEGEGDGDDGDGEGDGDGVKSVCCVFGVDGGGHTMSLHSSGTKSRILS